jgi:hypothetical protein
MVLEYVRMRNGPDIPNLSISKIANEIRTEEDGTPSGQIENVNNLLQKARPSVEFKIVFLGRFPEIQKELLEKKQPILALVNIADLPDTVKHAIVLTHYDEESHEVFYIDPLDHNTEKHIEVGSFIKKWGLQAIMVKVLVGEREQRHMPEWMEEKPNVEIEEA